MGGIVIFLVAIVSKLLSYTPSPSVQIGSTYVIGSKFGDVEFFGGIPYAKAPVGELRLNFPVLSRSIKARTLNAKTSGPGCIQMPSPPSGISEDCLTVDIYRPAGLLDDDKLPVMIWIYGGGFTVGASSYYNGTELVTRSIDRGTPIVFVSVNYRVGPLGFPQGIEAGRRKMMNLGMHDQLAALEWIQENIHFFGGDRAKVTLQGESAGAVSIQNFISHPRINSLARAAIIQSGAMLPVFEPERTEVQWQEFVAAVPDCAYAAGTNNTFDCLRSASSQSLTEGFARANITFMNMSFLPVIDGAGGLIVDRPSQINARGYLPLLIGENLDEGTLFAPQFVSAEAHVRGLVTAFVAPSLVSPETFNERMEQILELYPDDPTLGAPFGTGDETFGLSSQYKRCATILGDILIHSSRRIMTQKQARNGLPVFAYQFVDGDATVFPQFANPMAVPGSLGVTHSAEIPYVFGTLVNRTPGAAKLSVTMQDYWISFVNSIEPNDEHGNERPKWEQYTPQSQGILTLDGESIEMSPDNYRQAQVHFWQENADFLHR